jgi:hypothetical protein
MSFIFLPPQLFCTAENKQAFIVSYFYARRVGLGCSQTTFIVKKVTH